MDAMANRLHRTAKLELDEGRAQSIEDAMARAGSYVLQIQVGPGIEQSATRQAILLTVLNAGRRAFLGGVRVLSEDDPILDVGWAQGLHLQEAISRYGGHGVRALAAEHPTVVVGSPTGSENGGLTIHPTWEGWSAGVVEDPDRRLAEDCEFALSGVAAGALAVSEAFQHVRENPVAGRREVGLSLWAPGADWRKPESFGGPCTYLPEKLWLLGLGHLGQAYCWSLGFLPYADRGQAMLLLQDFDLVVEANESTGLLIDPGVAGQTKARVIAARMERLGFQTRISERAFDSDTKRRHEEPALALAGFDDPSPRRELEGANFRLVVDAGLGAGVDHYHEIVLHTFPSGLEARSTFPSRSGGTADIGPSAYQGLIGRREEEGETAQEAMCGALEIAGRTVGAAFVGAVAGTLVVAEALRMLAGGPRYQVIDLSLRSPQHRIAVDNERPGAFVNPGFLKAA